MLKRFSKKKSIQINMTIQHKIIIQIIHHQLNQNQIKQKIKKIQFYPIGSLLMMIILTLVNF